MTNAMATLEASLLRNGYIHQHHTVYAELYRSPKGAPIYILNPQIRDANFVLVAHPDFTINRSVISNVNQVHNGNFSKFRKRQNRGKEPEFYGQRVVLKNTKSVDDFLTNYSKWQCPPASSSS